jgi:hypothetical protein
MLTQPFHAQTMRNKINSQKGANENLAFSDQFIIKPLSICRREIWSPFVRGTAPNIPEASEAVPQSGAG